MLSNMNELLEKKTLQQTHLCTYPHRAGGPTTITKGIIGNRWMLWSTFYCKYWAKEQWGNTYLGKQACFSDQEYHLNHNNLWDEVASGWLNDRKVRSAHWARGEMGCRTLKKRKRKTNWITASRAPAKTECSLFLQINAAIWLRWKYGFRSWGEL